MAARITSVAMDRAELAVWSSDHTAVGLVIAVVWVCNDDEYTKLEIDVPKMCDELAFGSLTKVVPEKKGNCLCGLCMTNALSPQSHRLLGKRTSQYLP